MRTVLLQLLPVTLLAVAGAGAQDTVVVAPGAEPLILSAEKSKPAPKSSPKPPQRFKVTPVPQTSPVRPMLVQPRYTMPVAQHDLSQYPMPVTAGKGLPVRIPVAPPKPPLEVP